MVLFYLTPVYKAPFQFLRKRQYTQVAFSPVIEMKQKRMMKNAYCYYPIIIFPFIYLILPFRWANEYAISLYGLM